MARLAILEYPDPRLRIRATAVEAVDDEVRQLVADLFETMYAAPGIGLAATQVDVHKRVLVTDVSEDRNEPWCLINPEILSKEGEISFEEGCLSVPDVFEAVTRAEKIRVRCLDENGEVREFDAEGLLAICIQHEADHLDGKLFVDYLSSLKRDRLKKKIVKKAKRAGAEERDDTRISAPVI
ncbi:MAG TPA: peptide deformylase [Gammaproteobacteria bacterium]